MIKITRYFLTIVVIGFWETMKCYSADSTLVRVHFFDTNIVIVNAGHLNREGLTQLINNVSEGNPKVVGLNLCLTKATTTPYDSLLLKALDSLNNLVLQSDGDYKFVPNGNYGNSSFLIDEKKLVTSFSYDTSSFEYKIIKAYSPEKLITLNKRGNREELIRRLCNFGCFGYIQTNASIEKLFPPEILTGKIVLIGYLGGENLKFKKDDNGYSYMVNETEDAFFTFLNKTNYKYPDIYSTDIIANILSMILSEEY